MSRIKGKDTTPELLLRKTLFAKGHRYRKHYKLLGNPDIVFPKVKLAIFVDGDFWHGFTYVKRKKTLPTYWVEKIKRNMKRDKKYTKVLRAEGWTVLRIWEHDINKDTDKVTNNIIQVIKEQRKK